MASRTHPGRFDYIHKKQSGGSGQYGRVIGYLQPTEGTTCSFKDVTVGQNVPKNFIPSIEKARSVAWCKLREKLSF
jgi:elongation factor G